jgi:hypothetical protein
MSGGRTFRVIELMKKVERRGPMATTRNLEVSAVGGVVGDVNPCGPSPRQVSIAVLHSLEEQGVTIMGSRSNLILATDSHEHSIQSGSLLNIGDVCLRVTMPCEPCGHGARLANVPPSRLGKIERYLAVVVVPGSIEIDTIGVSHAGVYDATPNDFVSRCTWALDRIPERQVVSSIDFLIAIGGSRSYGRVLPKWLRYAEALGKPVHRVLTAGMRSPSWAPNALDLLAEEGLNPDSAGSRAYPLAEKIWFEDNYERSFVATDDITTRNTRIGKNYVR